MFFSLDRPMTKNLILNTKCQLKFCCCCFILKREEDNFASSKNETATKILADILLFSIKFLVISLSNEKNIEDENFLAFTEIQTKSCLQGMLEKKNLQDGLCFELFDRQLSFLLKSKGQLISKCPFGVFKSPKKSTKFFPGFLPQPLKRGQIKK